MPNAIQFLIAQHIPDVFRQEAFNVGVIAHNGVQMMARFLGEKEEGGIDKRVLRAIDYTNVYTQWIEYWRKSLKGECASVFNQLIKNTSENYRLLLGGELSGAEDDTLSQALEYLYTVLVAEGGIAEALSHKEEAHEKPTLVYDVKRSFMDAQIFATDDQQSTLVRYPVKPNVPLIGGSSLKHTPAFYQQNGKSYVMEVIDFSIRTKATARDHAGRTSYMFQDLREASGGSSREMIAIVMMNPSDKNENVEYGLAMLRHEATAIVQWNDLDQRQEFVEERRRIAVSNESHF